jgi:hypothetical protein
VEPEDDNTKEAVQVAQKVLKKNLLNIIKKVGEGKTLSAGELTQMQALADGTESKGAITYAKNQVELSDAIGVDRKTIQRWLKVKGCPEARPDGRYSVIEWRTWAENTGRKLAETDDFDTERGRLEVRRLRTICERLDLELEVTKGTYTANDEITKQIHRMINSARKILGAIPSQLAPQVVGMSIPDAEQRIREQVDNAMKQLHESEWT